MAFLPIPGLFTAVYCRLSRTFFLAPCSLDMAELAAVSLVASLVFLALAVLPLPASAWNIPAHMLSAAITYQVLSQENPRTIEKVKTLLEKYPWYANQWQIRLQAVSGADRDMVLFMQAVRSADDIRSWDKAQNRPPGHYINLLFKPEDQPPAVQIRDPEPVNILTALAENESVMKKETESRAKRNCNCVAIPSCRGHTPALHAAQLFTV
jgi:hypothetical protein